MKRNIRRLSRMRRFAIVLAALPLFQLSQCQTGINRTFANFANGAPSTYFNTLLGIGLLPFQLLLTGNTGTGGFNGDGGGGF